MPFASNRYSLWLSGSLLGGVSARDVMSEAKKRHALYEAAQGLGIWMLSIDAVVREDDEVGDCVLGFIFFQVGSPLKNRIKVSVQ